MYFSSTYAHTASRVLAGRLCSFFLVRERMNQESGPKGLMPFGNPQREMVASLSLCSSFREDKQIQTLRWRLEVQAPTRKTHAMRQSKRFCYVLRAPVRTNFKQKRDSKNPLLDLFAFELSKANTKAEFLAIRANMSRAAVPRRVVCARTNGFQRRSLGRPSCATSCGEPRSGTRNSNRSARARGAKYDRP